METTNNNGNLKKRAFAELHIIFILSFIMIFFVAGCSERNEEESVFTENDEIYIQESSLTLNGAERLSVASFSDDRLYYPVYTEEGSNLQLYSVDLNTLKSEIFYRRMLSAQEKILYVAASSSGEVALLFQSTGQADAGEMEAAYELVLLDEEGQERIVSDISDVFLAEREIKTVSVSHLIMDNQGNIYMVLQGEAENLLKFNREGKLECKTPVQKKIQSLLATKAGEIYCIIVDDSMEGYEAFLQKIDKNAEMVSESCQILPEKVITSLISGWGDDAFIFSSGDKFYRYNKEKNEWLSMGDWLNYGINSDDILLITGLENDRVAAIVNSFENNGKGMYSELVILGKNNQSGGITENEINEDKVTLTLGTVSFDVMMRAWIADYNKAHPNCTIEVKEYGQGDYGVGVIQLNADIVSGNAPDLIDLSDIDIDSYISKGVLADLSGFLEADGGFSKDDIMPGALRLYEEEDKLYGLAAGVTLETLMGKTEIIGGREEWTIENVRKKVEEITNETEFIENLSPAGLLRILLQTGMNSYIDWSTGECYFDGEDFIEILELAKSMQGFSYTEEETKSKLASDTLLLYRAYISDIFDYVSAVDYFGEEEVVCVGYPSESGGHANIRAYMPLGMVESCEYKQEAWEFIRSLLSIEFQRDYLHFQIPVRTDVLQSQVEQYISNLEQEDNPDWVRESMNLLYDAVNTGLGERAFNQKIWNIIEEESGAYFAGEKGVEDTVAVIQARVRIYVSENY